MEIPVLVEPITGQGFRARSGEPVSFCAEGATPEEALGNLEHLIQGKLRNGAELRRLSVPERHPWLRMGAIFRENDPAVEDWKNIMEENREKAEQDPSYL